MPNCSAEAWPASSRVTDLRFSSSATMRSKVPASSSPPGTTTVIPASGWRTRSWWALRRAEPLEQIVRVVSMRATRSASAGNSEASGQSVRCTERPAVSPRQISSATRGSSGAATRQTVSRQVYSTSKATVSSSKNRSRERRTYQLVRVSM